MQQERTNYSTRQIDAENKHLLESFPNHMAIADKEHGVSVNFITNDNSNEVLGLAGLHYLSDVQLYEIIINILPEHSLDISVTELIENIVSEAFEVLCLDKVCARAVPGSEYDVLLKSFGFTQLGERVFSDESKSSIYNYYELENDSLLEINASSSTPAYSDWDNIF